MQLMSTVLTLTIILGNKNKSSIATSDANSRSFFNYIDVMVNGRKTVVISITCCLT